MCVGEKVIDQVIASKLFTVTCPDSPESSCLVVWTIEFIGQEENQKLLDRDKKEVVERRLADAKLASETEQKALFNFRKWTNLRGDSVTAKFVKFESSKVQLQREDGKKFFVQIATLSESDKQVIDKIKNTLPVR